MIFFYFNITDSYKQYIIKSVHKLIQLISLCYLNTSMVYFIFRKKTILSSKRLENLKVLQLISSHKKSEPNIPSCYQKKGKLVIIFRKLSYWGYCILYFLLGQNAFEYIMVIQLNSLMVLLGSLKANSKKNDISFLQLKIFRKSK